MFNVIALMATAVAGMFGWYCAWRARGDALDARAATAAAVAGETAAKDMAVAAKAAAAVAAQQAIAAAARGDALQSQLDTERASRQALVDAIAKSGAPLGPLVVDDALGRLYAPEPAVASPSPAPAADAGGNPVPVSGGHPVIARTTTRS